MNIRTKLLGLVIGAAFAGAAQSAEYSVGIVDVGTTYPYGGTGVNLYTTTERGVKLVHGSPLVFQPKLPQGATTTLPAEPIEALVSSDQHFVYVAYCIFAGLPVLAKFEITPTGLRYQWQRVLSSGDITLDGGTVVSAGDYVLEKVYPNGLYIHVLNSAGEEILGDSNVGTQALNSSHMDAKGKFYFSCRGLSDDSPTSVAIFDLDVNNAELTVPSVPFVVSTDPVFVQGNCPVPPAPLGLHPSG